MLSNFFGLSAASPVLSFVCNPINAGAIAMIAGLIIVPLVSAFTPKLEFKAVEHCFAAYDK